MIQFDGGKLDMYNEGWFTLLEPVVDSNAYLPYFRLSAKVFEKKTWMTVGFNEIARLQFTDKKGENTYVIEIKNDGTKTMSVNDATATNADYTISNTDFKMSHRGRRSDLSTWNGIELTVTRQGLYFGMYLLSMKVTVEPYRGGPYQTANFLLRWTRSDCKLFL